MFDWILNAPQVKAVRTLNSEINISVAPWSDFYTLKYVLCTTQSFADVSKIGVLKIWRPSTLLKRDSITGAFLTIFNVKMCQILLYTLSDLLDSIYLLSIIKQCTHPHSPPFISTHRHPTKIFFHPPLPFQNNAPYTPNHHHPPPKNVPPTQNNSLSLKIIPQ